MFSKTSEPISTKLVTNQFWVKGGQIVQMKGYALFKGILEIITNSKNTLTKFINKKL